MDEQCRDGGQGQDEAPAEPTPEPATGSERPWWDSEGMPWRREPGRADIACLTWFGVVGVVSLILLPTRAWFMATAPDWLAMLTGGRTSVAATGALASVGEIPHWPIVLVVASVLSLKFDWVYWWAGRLWGRGMIEVWSGQSPRAARNYARAERWAERLGPLGFLLAYVPVPLPLMPVVFVLAGASGMSLRRFFFYDYVASTLWLLGFFALGWRLGDAAVAVLEAYAKIAGYVAIGLVVAILVTTYLNRSRKARAH